MHPFSKRKLMSLLSASALVGALFVATLPGVATAAIEDCTLTGFSRDGHELTARVNNPAVPVTGVVDAAGCNIGVYYGPGHTGSVTGADVSHANYFGVLVNGAAVSLTGTGVHDIGETPLNGSQHGNAIVYLNGASGTISDNTVIRYQKNGITVSGVDAAGAIPSDPTTSASVQNNVVRGEGPVTYIAQNGIQISFGASAKVVGNDVSLNNYTPAKVTACGLLIYKAGGVGASSKDGIAFIKAENNFHDNETDICNFGKGGGFSD